MACSLYNFRGSDDCGRGCVCDCDGSKDADKGDHQDADTDYVVDVNDEGYGDNGDDVDGGEYDVDGGDHDVDDAFYSSMGRYSVSSEERCA